MRIHDLRHSAASMLLADGVPVKVVIFRQCFAIPERFVKRPARPERASQCHGRDGHSSHSTPGRGHAHPSYVWFRNVHASSYGLCGQEGEYLLRVRTILQIRHILKVSAPSDLPW